MKFLGVFMSKIKIAGIIAEYNPFHSGHLHQIEMLKKQGFTHIIAVCSPCVVQRGEAALFPTQVRTNAALACGVDIVLSLPAPFAILSAEGFAKAAVKILSSCGVCDYIAFGAETPKTQLFIKTAEILRTKEYETGLKAHLNSGISYAAARQKAIEDIDEKCAKLLSKPNNILGVEYCKALLETRGKKPSPLALKRKGANHDEKLKKDASTASASAIRALANNASEKINIASIKPYVPKACFIIYKEAVKNGLYIKSDAWEIAILSRLRALDEKTASEIRANSEGLDKLLLKAVAKNTSLNEIYSAMKSKRYAHSRIRRFVLNAALGYDELLPQSPEYIHVLGASNEGKKIMSLIKANATLPFSSSLSTLAKTSKNAWLIASAHADANNLASLCLKNAQPCGGAFTQKFITVEK